MHHESNKHPITRRSRTTPGPKLNQSRNWIINEAVKEFLEQRSFDEERWQDTLVALDSVNNGKRISAEKVESWLASWVSSEEQVAPHQ